MKYAKIEKLGVKHEGSDVVILLEGKEIRMPWKVAMLLARNIGEHSIQARSYDAPFNSILKEISNG